MVLKTMKEAGVREPLLMEEGEGFVLIILCVHVEHRLDPFCRHLRVSVKVCPEENLSRKGLRDKVFVLHKR